MTGPHDYPHLARPLALRGIAFRNRLAVAPMCAMYAAPDGSATPRVIEYYRARAAGGAGLVIVEITFTDRGGSRAFHAQLGAHDDTMIPGLNDLAAAIKGAGAVAGLQLGHCGSQRVVKEPPVVAPSPIPWMEGKRVPHELTVAEIAQIVDDHAQAARRVAEAGFDLLELHGAHGYLINTFLCPATNRRNDAYGGSAPNRLRFALEVVEAVRAALGPKRLLSFRINGDDLLPGGLEIADYADIARALAQAGVDILHVSAGTYRVMERRVAPMYLEEGQFIDYAGPIRRAAGVPVIASGSIHDPALAESVLSRGDADFVSMARPFFADPELAGKVTAGRTAEIRPCIRCNTCLAREQAGWRGLCAINPRTGYENETVLPSPRRREVMVVGGGPAGIEAALNAAARGHRVTLVERETMLGGKLAIAATLKFKRTIPRLLAYYHDALERAGVRLLLGSEAPEKGADVVIVATGAQADRDKFRGTIPVLDAAAALANPATLGKKLLIVGATTVGLEAAWHLGSIGHDVTVAERDGEPDDDVNLIARLVLPGAVERAGGRLAYATEVSGLEGGAALMQRGNQNSAEKFDAVLLACALAPRLPPAIAAWRRGGATVLFAGECAGQRGLIGATHSAYRAVLSF